MWVFRPVRLAQADHGKETVDFDEHQEADPLCGSAGHPGVARGEYLSHFYGLHGLMMTIAPAVEATLNRRPGFAVIPALRR